MARKRKSCDSKKPNQRKALLSERKHKDLQKIADKKFVALSLVSHFGLGERENGNNNNKNKDEDEIMRI